MVGTEVREAPRCINVHKAISNPELSAFASLLAAFLGPEISRMAVKGMRAYEEPRVQHKPPRN